LWELKYNAQNLRLNPKKEEKSLKKQSVLACILLAAWWVQLSSATPPVKSWSKVLEKSCNFTAIRGDTVIAITDRIILLSSAGQIINQTPSLSDLQNLTAGKFSFAYLKDNTVLLIKDKYLLKKIALSGEVIFSVNLRDSVPSMSCNGFVENDDGTLFICGDISHQSAVLIAISHNNNIVFCNKFPSFSAFYAMTAKENTIYISSSDPSVYQPSKLICIDTDGKYVNTISDKCNGTVLLFSGGVIYSLGVKDGGSLFKSAFSATRDILLKRFTPDGTLKDTALFDFGKYQNTVDLIKQNDGFVMVTSSDESPSFGTNILNYFVTKIDGDLKKEWQFRFGTDTSDYMSATKHSRSYFADEQGRVLSCHNDTLSVFAVANTVNRYYAMKTPSAQNDKQIFGLNGRLLPCSRGEWLSSATGCIIRENGNGGKKRILFSGTK
jgi:hypothetical protein